MVAAPEDRHITGDTPVLGAPGGDAQHGTSSASVAAGATLGTCPECLIAFHQAVDTARLAAEPWIDVTSHSWMRAGRNEPSTEPARVAATRAAARRGQVTLFAAGNGQGTSFLQAPLVDGHASEDQGPSWVVQVGGVDRATGRPLVGDQAVVKISSYAAGEIPSAAGDSETGVVSHSGTSAASPITAVVFGRVLAAARRELGDGGGRPAGVVALGTPVAGSPWLADGRLTRAELLKLVLKTAVPARTDNAGYAPGGALKAPYDPRTNVAFEGYGVADTASATRAIRVLRGFDPLPDRSYEDDFFRRDRTIRDARWGPCGCADELD